MRPAWRDALISAGALALLLIGLVSIDDRVREHAGDLVRATTSPAGLADAGAQVRDATWVIAVAVKEQSVAHAPLMLFMIVATILVVFMLRT